MIPRLLIILLAFLGTISGSVAASAAASPLVTGRILGIAPAPDGSATVAGWACQTGNPAPIQVRLYIGDPYPAGQIVSTTTANVDSPTSACSTGGTHHGFTFELGPDIVFRYGGLRLFAYAVLPGDTSNPQIDAPASATLPGWTPIGATPRNCDITDFASLKRCAAQIGQFDQISIRQDLTCTSASECCGPNSSALISLDGVARRVIDGNGHTIYRGPGALTCSAIVINRSSDVLIRNLSLDEGKSVPPCELGTKDCPHTVSVNLSHNVRIENTHFYFGKGYVVYAWGTNGFAFVQSSLSESGIIGLYVGHYKYAPSHNIVIADSIFAHARTSGIALQGAYGSDPANPVLIINNLFTRNHWHGLWPVPGVKNGITTGGQVLIADADNVRFTNNVVADGACGNCNPPGQTVTGVEIGDDPHPPAGVFNLTIDHNYVRNLNGIAFYQNRDTPVAGVAIKDNRLAGGLRLDMVTGSPARSKNVQEPELPRAKHQPALSLSIAPQPGALAAPIYRCLRNGAEIFARTLTCDGDGQLQSVLGFSYEPTNPAARPFFVCQLPKFGDDQILSFDPKCEGGRTIGQFGFAIPT